MRKLFVGIDVSKDDFKAVVKDDSNNLVMPVKTYRHDRPGMEGLDEDIGAVRKQFRCGVVFGMEATGIYHLSLYQHLLDRKEQVKVFNGLELKRFKNRIRKTKTDKLDALAIADALVLTMEPSYHPIAEPELLRIRELCRVRDRLMKKVTLCKVQAIRNMDVLCRGYTDAFSDIFGLSSIAVMKATVRTTKLFKMDTEALTALLSKYMPRSTAEKKAITLSALFQNAVVPDHMKEATILELHMSIKQYEVLKQQLERIDHRIERLVKDIDTYLLTIPGIGLLTAGMILGELGDLSRFKSIKQLTAFAGLDPSVKESGRSRHTGHISKRGSPMLREALYQAALSAIQVNPVCKQFYLRLKNRNKPHRVCRIAVARKLLHMAYSVERNQRDFYVPKYIAEQQA